MLKEEGLIFLSVFTLRLDIVYHPWKKEKDEAGNQTREIMYTVSLTNPLAPKTATVTETQVSGASQWQCR